MGKNSSLYLTKGLNNRLYMIKSMFEFRYAEGISIRTNLDEFNKLMMDWKNVIEVLADET